MRKLLLVVALMLPTMLFVRAQEISSPDKNLTLKFELQTNGVPTYQLSYKQKPVIKPSKLGLETKDVPSFLDGFMVTKTEQNTFDESWNPVWGEQKTIRNK